MPSVHRLSVFWKVLLVFILLIFPMYMSGVYVVMKGQSSVRDELLKAAESKGKFYISSLESQLYNAMRLQLNVLNDADIATLNRSETSISPVDRVIMLNRVRDTLRNVANMNDYIEEITVYLPSQNIKVTTQTIMPIDMNEYNIFLKNTVVENLPFCNIDGCYYINMTPEFYSQTMPYRSDNMLLVSARISQKAISSSMVSIAGVEGGGSLLISDGRGLDISSGDVKDALRDAVAAWPFDGDIAREVDINDTGYQIFFSPSQFLHSALVIYMPESGFMQTLKSFSGWIWIISALTVLLVMVFSVWIRGMIAKPLEKLIAALRQVEDGVIDVQVDYGKNDEFGYIYKQFNHLVGQLKELISDVYRKELMLKDAEFKQLQYQINPHFLYNSLLVAKGLIEFGYNDAAVQLTGHLSGYYQYITKALPGDVKLEQEIEHIRNYTEVQNIRFQGRIKCEIQEADECIKNIRVPRLILQPIVENAYKHGLKNKLNGGLLRVSFCKEQNYVHITIEDNGEELTDQVLDEMRYELSQPECIEVAGTGIKNVNDRLRIRFGRDSGVKVGRSVLGGLKADIVIYTGDEQTVCTTC
ncbi:sensor histidine kinase [Mahella australiensis]|uniref:Signal transduction histidine kinase, LytS n=1 Tax=Mahella australiensis (strain DSM 15567 / CIP 107919 / 50-1 BON) TaxID=697281 RepID=F4A0U5_MAHA5|nr:histidine kinase [Mahella australiensis]AEE96991.1 signal transduction histidine kinase, LytS [Mahella australiensis 50-1 BON]